jgi:DNA-binding transcriptional MerR regulator
MTATTRQHEPMELSIDDLAAQSGVPSRTIREYQSLGLVLPPDRRGRTGVYGSTHRRRLALIGRLQQRGYSLAGIRDLLSAWTAGADISEVLGVEADDLVHIDEPGAKVALPELAQALPTLVPDHIDDLLRVRLIDLCGPDTFCVPSPSLLHLSADMIRAGYTTDQVLGLLTTISEAASAISNAATRLLVKPPKGVSEAALDRLASRGRGLLAHGTGRLTIYNLGRQLASDATGRGAARS